MCFIGTKGVKHKILDGFYQGGTCLRALRPRIELAPGRIAYFCIYMTTRPATMRPKAT